MTHVNLPDGVDIDSLFAAGYSNTVTGYPDTLELRDHPHAEGLFQTPCGAVVQNLKFLGTEGEMNIHEVRVVRIARGYSALKKGRTVRMDIGPNGGVELERS